MDKRRITQSRFRKEISSLNRLAALRIAFMPLKEEFRNSPNPGEVKAMKEFNNVLNSHIAAKMVEIHISLADQGMERDFYTAAMVSLCKRRVDDKSLSVYGLVMRQLQKHWKMESLNPFFNLAISFLNQKSGVKRGKYVDACIACLDEIYGILESVGRPDSVLIKGVSDSFGLYIYRPGYLHYFPHIPKGVTVLMIIGTEEAMAELRHHAAHHPVPPVRELISKSLVQWEKRQGKQG